MTYTTQVNVKKWRSVKFLRVSLAWCLWPRISVTWVAKAGESWAEGIAGLKRKFWGRLGNLLDEAMSERVKRRSDWSEVAPQFVVSDD